MILETHNLHIVLLHHICNFYVLVPLQKNYIPRCNDWSLSDREQKKYILADFVQPAAKLVALFTCSTNDEF